LVKLRLRRIGRKKLPLYKIVAADSRTARDGRFIEALGNYDPNNNPPKLDFKEDRVFYWLKTGAKPTNTVRNLLSSRGIMLRHHLMKKGADEAKINKEVTKWSTLQEAKMQKSAERRLRKKAGKKKKSKAGKDQKAEAGAEVKSEENPEQPAASGEGA
jgi:small subunit ribosomal protein S16